MTRIILIFSFVAFFLGSMATEAVVYAGAPLNQNKADSGHFSKKDKKGHLWEYKKSFNNFYSIQDDIKLGKQVMGEQIKEFNEKGIGVDAPKNQELKARIERIVKKITAVSDKPDYPYEVHIFDRPDVVNAFCMPGGKIGVFTGLFDKEKGLVDINSDNQIAAVLAHEISHATLRHITRRISTLQGISIFGAIASVAIGVGAGTDFQDTFNQVFSLGMNLYIPSYSRKYEKAADRTGFYYMSKAGFDPNAAIEIWKKAAARGGPNSKKTDFFASHPSDASRAKALEHWLPDALLVKAGKAPLSTSNKK